MSNVLKVNYQETIRNLYEQGWSQRRIARELGLHRRTVGRYIAAAPKCTTLSTAGSDGDAPGVAHVSSAGTWARKSLCDAFRETICAKLNGGLSAQRIHQDLVEENGFAGSYQSVKRFVARLKEKHPERVYRMECQPGEEMQVDFGLGAPIDEGEGKRSRRTWVFRAVLSYSRKGYSEAVTRQDTETFLRCLENAVRHFGGVPMLLNLDNLKAAVLKADWFDPEINPKLADFCRHYGMHAMPCRPWTPQHKGKIERGVGYVKGNALKGRRFRSLSEENLHLQKWETNVADKRIHGTTCKQVAALFAEERPHLQPLPDALFPCYQEALRNVSRDSFVEVQKAYYEAPPEYIGQQIWVRWDGRSVRLFNARMEQIQLHTRIEPGRFSRILGAAGFSAPVRTASRQAVSRAAVLGEHCGAWAQAAFDTRGPEALRSILGLCDLVKKHSATAIDSACAKAIRAGTRRLKDIKQLIGEPGEQGDFGFATSHPLIRDLKIYGDFINQTHTASHQTNPTQHPDPHKHDQQPPQTIRPDAAPLGAA